jgi:hypothetical protein
MTVSSQADQDFPHKTRNCNINQQKTLQKTTVKAAYNALSYILCFILTPAGKFSA